MAEDMGYCDICKTNFGDPMYHGCGPSSAQWEKHYGHLFPTQVALDALEELHNRGDRMYSPTKDELSTVDSQVFELPAYEGDDA